MKLGDARPVARCRTRAAARRERNGKRDGMAFNVEVAVAVCVGGPKPMVRFPDVGPDARIVMSLGNVLALRGGGDRPGHPECSEEHWDRSLDRQPPFEMVEAPGVALRAR